MTAGLFAEGLVLECGEINRELPVLPQEINYANVSLTLSNVGGEFSLLRGSEPWRNRKVSIHHATFADGAGALTPIFTGKVNDWSLNPEQCTVDLRDAAFDVLGEEIRTVTEKSIFPYLPTGTPRQLVPVIYGVVDSAELDTHSATNYSAGGNVSIVSGVATFTVGQPVTVKGYRLTYGGHIAYMYSRITDYVWLVTSALGNAPPDHASVAVDSITYEQQPTDATNRGAVAAILVDDRAISNSDYKFVYVLAAHVLKRLLRVYHYGELIEESAYVHSSTTYGGKLMDIIMFATDQRHYDEQGNRDREGEAEITFDAEGVCAVTPGAELLYLHPAIQLRDYLINHVGIAAADLASATNCAHTATCADAFYHAAEYHKGYRLDFAIDGEVRSYAEVVAGFAQSANLMLYQTKKGKYSCTYSDIKFTGNTDFLEEFTEEHDILGVPSWTPVKDHASRVNYSYKRDYATGTWLQSETRTNTIEDGHLGVTGKGLQVAMELPYVRNNATALNVILGRMRLMREARMLVVFDAPISRIADVELGDYILVTHGSGPSSDGLGWDQEIVKVIGLRTSLSPDGMRLTVTAIDTGYDVDGWEHVIRWGDARQNSAHWVTATDWDKTFFYWGTDDVYPLRDPIKYWI